MKSFSTLTLLLLLPAFSILADDAFTASSGESRTALLELYTSEGCSSCPPAEKWLGRLEQEGFSPDKVIPIAFHVDYWDYIGWKDRFADARYSERQRRLGRLNRLNTIYTPQFVLNGEDLRPVRLIQKRLPEITSTASEIKLTLSAKFIESHSIEVNWQTEPQLKNSEHLYLVITENRLKTQVKAGENSGRTLDHEHIARSFIQVTTEPSAAVTVPFAENMNTKNINLVGFIENTQGQILQALKLPLHQ